MAPQLPTGNSPSVAVVDAGTVGTATGRWRVIAMVPIGTHERNRHPRNIEDSGAGPRRRTRTKDAGRAASHRLDTIYTAVTQTMVTDVYGCPVCRGETLPQTGLPDAAG